MPDAGPSPASHQGPVPESMAVGFFTLTSTWRMTDVNPASEAILGSPASALEGRVLWEVYPGTRELAFGQTYEAVMTDRQPRSFEAFYPGLGLWFEVRVQPAADGIAVYFLDVTPRHQADERAAAGAARLDLLARVSEALAGTDDPDEAVGRLARLVVPQLADWSFVTVIGDDGRWRDVGLAHRDRDREEDLAAYSARHLEVMTPGAAVVIALQGVSHVVVPHLSDDLLDGFIPDATAAALTRRLDPCGVASFPLVARGRTFGALTIVTTSPRGPHTDEEIETALEVARRAAPVLEAARAAHRARALAESMQRSLLAVSPPGPNVEVVTRYRPAAADRQVGGDWYDTFGLPGGSTVITIGDVMGHDVPAIAAMGQLRTVMRSTAWTSGHSPAEVLAATDDVSFGLGSATFATALTAQLYPVGPDGTIVMSWSNAGHPPPVLLRADGTVSVLDTARVDIPLGVARGSERHNHTAVLRPGDVVLLYTDGLVERRGLDITVGIEALVRVVADVRGADLDALLDKVLVELASDPGTGDDIALLALQVHSRRAPVSGPAQLAPASVATVKVRVPADTIAPAIGRDHVQRMASHLAASVVSDAEVLVSELLGNAVRHGRAPVMLRLDVGADRIRVAVSDSGPGRPVLPAARPEPTRTSGRGLLILDAIATSWGVDPIDSAAGKTVWFEIAPD